VCWRASQQRSIALLQQGVAVDLSAAPDPTVLIGGLNLDQFCNIEKGVEIQGGQCCSFSVWIVRSSCQLSTGTHITYYGGQASELVTLDNCCKLCINDYPYCTGFSYETTSRNCYLKTKLSRGRVKLQQVISGTPIHDKGVTLSRADFTLSDTRKWVAILAEYCAGTTACSNYQIAVARYKEPISWIKNAGLSLKSITCCSQFQTFQRLSFHARCPLRNLQQRA
jgi:hypothetical protein